MTDKTTCDLRTLIEASSELAEERMAADGEVTPVWRAFDADGRFYIIPSPPLDDKDAMMAVMRRIFAKLKIVRVVFTNEAWYVAAQGTDFAKLEAWLATHDDSIEDYPDRREIVMFHGEDADGLTLDGMRTIIRSGGGKPTLGPLEIHQLSNGEGRMIGMLPRPEGSTTQ